MLKIRFQRTGRKNDPAFRIVVGEHTKHPKSGSHAAILGSYHPKTKDLTLDEDAVKGWMEKGAKPSPTVHNLLISKGVIEGTKINVLPKKTPIVKEEEEKVEEAPSEASAEGTGEKSEDAPTEEEVTADAETEEASSEEPQSGADEQGETAPEEEKKEAA